ncbi:ADYC domain-containing protein [Haliangium sp.]|uniref:ADYC domain-containing protein n=1 Tax=Haliangium sp. TaxID=2663208 RepID=UPI003D102F93
MHISADPNHRPLHSLRSHDARTAGRRPRYLRAATIVLAALLGAQMTAQAGMRLQGMRLQGMRLQGMRLQGMRLQGPGLDGAALRGDTFIAALVDDHGAQVGMFEAESFRGDLVQGVLYDSAQGAGVSTTLPAAALIGVTWSEEICDDSDTCETITYRIAAGAVDDALNTMPAHADNDDVFLYRVEYSAAGDPGEGDWINVCAPDSSGVAMGMFVDGQWDAYGDYQPGGYTFSCTAGVIAKCARDWGYKPWKTLPAPTAGLVGLQPLHHACTRAARADYCGDGNAHTQDGTMIDMFDVYGFNLRELDSGFTRESGFDTDGARWVERPRYPDAESTDEGWRFATCERPAYDNQPPADGPILIEVWSAPDLGL